MDAGNFRQVLAYLKANAVEPVNGFFYLGPDGIITGVTKVDEDKIALGCGCVYWSDTGLPFASCKAHDRRTRDRKISAELTRAGFWIDEAGRHLGVVELQSAARHLVDAAKLFVRDPDDLG